MSAEIIFYGLGILFVSVSFVVFFGSPYVPTLRKNVADAMDIYPLGSGDVFVDVGSGDGIVLRQAAKTGAQAIGYELSPWLYLISKLLCRNNKNIRIYLLNFWRVDLPPETTVVYTFLNGHHINKLAEKLKKHVAQTGKPLHFISYGFALKDVEPLKVNGPVYLYAFQPLQT